MKSETLGLLNTLDEASAMVVARALQTVNGVSKVSIATANSTVDIDFDEDVTSIQELRATLQRAGFSPKRKAHADGGSCCGSCGG